jgi:acyl carrier protein
MTQIRETVINEFLKRRVIKSDSADLDHNYVKAGLIDSMGIVDLISVLEESLGFSFNDSDFTDPDFETINGMIRLIEKNKK